MMVGLVNTEWWHFLRMKIVHKKMSSLTIADMATGGILLVM